MSKARGAIEKIDICVLFYGKAYNTIVTLKSLLDHSGQHIDTIYLIHENKQPHGDVSGIYKVLDLFKDRKIVVYRPSYFYGLGGVDYDRAKSDRKYRWSLPYQYALEKTDKKYLMVVHNDVLFHGDIIGSRLAYMNDPDKVYAGIGSIGQCWSCPAHYELGCNGFKFREHKLSAEEYFAVAEKHPEFRRLDIARELVDQGRIFPLPECRMNEHAAMINVEIYRKEVLPLGDSVCFGGRWDGVDLGCVWFYQMINKGYEFKQVILEDHGTHSPFSYTGSGIASYDDREIYEYTEREARKYYETHYHPLTVGMGVKVRSELNAAYYHTRRFVGRALLVLRRLIGK